MQHAITVQLANISSESSVPLRVRSFKSNATPRDNTIADGVTCKNGHDAVYMNPHGTNYGTITVRNVTVDSCESALSIRQIRHQVGLTGSLLEWDSKGSCECEVTILD